MNLKKISFKTTSAAALIFGDALDEQVLAVSWHEIDEDTDHWVFEATVSDAHDLDLIQSLLVQAAAHHQLAVPQIVVEVLPETDWLEQTWKNFPPRQIGRFYVYGSHTKGDVPAGLIGMEINAATAFGSGEHETTTACIEALTKMHAQGMTFNKPLDMGCGSGILAMAIAKLWGISVLAVDNDPESVRVATRNAELNTCDDLVSCLCNEGFDGTVVKDQGPFDLVSANILAAPLCEMAPDMADCVAPKGRIVLSGLLTRQIDQVRQSYEAVDFTFVEHHLIGDWAALVFEKK
ncbi:MAG: 50S ribosomal protein L11 methyltransferase [Candidatus Paracaedibacteraceae bacterium]|nr:50S ribosomal protein L11 methyltransferase [Candidatus Paracaedibacteraceae bacterium]